MVTLALCKPLQASCPRLAQRLGLDRVEEPFAAVELCSALVPAGAGSAHGQGWEPSVVVWESRAILAITIHSNRILWDTMKPVG